MAAGDTPENTGIRSKLNILIDIIVTDANQSPSAYADRLAAGKGIKLYIDWHSYGQYILTYVWFNDIRIHHFFSLHKLTRKQPSPYGYSTSAKAPNQAAQDTLARNVATAIAAVHGKRFTTGPTAATLYVTNGGSNDYLTDVSKAQYA